MAKTTDTSAVKAMAMKYYPKYWNIQRLQALVKAGSLTQKDMDEIVAAKKEG